MTTLAFIGPGGPEFIMIMLVLLLLFGAKDAPRIFRKMNEALNHLRNTADSFKREIMYGDLNDSSGTSAPEDYGDESVYDEDYDYDHDHHEGDYTQEDVEQDYSDETFANLEKDLEAVHSEDQQEEPVYSNESYANLKKELDASRARKQEEETAADSDAEENDDRKT